MLACRGDWRIRETGWRIETRLGRPENTGWWGRCTRDGGFRCTEWSRQSRILDPRKCRVRPKQGDAVLPPKQSTTRYVLHQDLAVATPSIPVLMCCSLPWCAGVPASLQCACPSDVVAPRVPRLDVCVTAQHTTCLTAKQLTPINVGLPLVHILTT
ncbi:hypothetical protein F5883DRAFT_51686 [Diaporthe sp. PMI_573]|nr:hypothetical protein F5883DRAFT_51686 [Diaporthaceae sp. PMI_573]